jgi:hypothetical protein
VPTSQDIHVAIILGGRIPSFDSQFFFFADLIERVGLLLRFNLFGSCVLHLLICKPSCNKSSVTLLVGLTGDAARETAEHGTGRSPSRSCRNSRHFPPDRQHDNLLGALTIIICVTATHSMLYEVVGATQKVAVIPAFCITALKSKAGQASSSYLNATRR